MVIIALLALGRNLKAFLKAYVKKIYFVCLDPSKPLEFTYQAASPDDKALVVFAKNMHYFFVDIQAEQLQVGNERLEGSQMLVRINGEDVLFDVLDIIEFSSARKRQSTIVRDPRSGTNMVFKN